jgi:hypothetical protein
MDTELGCIKNTVSEAELFNNKPYRMMPFKLYIIHQYI